MTKFNTKYTMEEISQGLDAIFGAPEPPIEPQYAPLPSAFAPTAVVVPARPEALFIENPTPAQITATWNKICNVYGDGDDFIEGMIRYRQKKLRDAAKEADKKAKEAARKLRR